MRMRSLTSNKCGEVKSPVLYFEDLRMLSTIQDVDPWKTLISLYLLAQSHKGRIVSIM